MDLNSIELTPYVMANLYPGTLVDGETVITRGPEENKRSAIVLNDNEAPDQSKKYLGNNNRQILVLVDHSDVMHIPDNELSLLTGILSACKLGLDDIALANMNNYRGSTYKELNKEFKPVTVLLFDTTPGSIDLPMNFPYFQPQSFNGTTYLFSPALKDLENDKIIKSKLWLCLKKIFDL